MRHNYYLALEQLRCATEVIFNVLIVSGSCAGSDITGVTASAPQDLMHFSVQGMVA